MSTASRSLVTKGPDMKGDYSAMLQGLVNKCTERMPGDRISPQELLRQIKEYVEDFEEG